jgi:ferrous iron transport protein A
VATHRHFSPFRHSLEIYGLCNECLPATETLRPLTDAAIGERVRVVSAGGGRRLVQRLSDLGLVPNREIQVVNNTGPLIVALDNTRIALGRGVAAKILVK